MRTSDWSSDVCSSDLLKAPVDYAQAGATTPAPSRKTRRQDMPGTGTNGGVDRCLLRGTPGYWAGKSRPTSVGSAAFTVTSSTKRSAALMPSGRTGLRYSPTGRVWPAKPNRKGDGKGKRGSGDGEYGG